MRHIPRALLPLLLLPVGLYAQGAAPTPNLRSGIIVGVMEKADSYNGRVERISVRTEKYLFDLDIIVAPAIIVGGRIPNPGSRVKVTYRRLDKSEMDGNYYTGTAVRIAVLDSHGPGNKRGDQQSATSFRAAEELLQQLVRDNGSIELPSQSGRTGAGTGLSKLFDIKRIDLNRDGRAEFIITINQNDASLAQLCGQRGFNCPVWIYRKTPKGYQSIVEPINSFRPLTTSANGYRDLEVSSHGGYSEIYVTVYKFDGTQYRRTECFVRQYQGEAGTDVPHTTRRIECYSAALGESEVASQDVLSVLGAGKPTRAAAVQVLIEFVSALESGKLDRAKELSVEKIFTEWEIRYSPPDHSPRGAEALGRQGFWLNLADLASMEDGKIYKDLLETPSLLGVERSRCYALIYGAANAAFYWNGRTFKVFRVDDLATLERGRW